MASAIAAGRTWTAWWPGSENGAGCAPALSAGGGLTIVGMSMQIQPDDDHRSDWSVVPLALAFGLGLGAVGWWLTQDEPAENTVRGLVQVDQLPPTGASAEARSALPAAAPKAVAFAQVPPAPAVSAQVSAAVPAAAVPAPAAVGLESDFGQPVSSRPHSRPPFMNANEWDAASSAYPAGAGDSALVRLVNAYRFRRLQEHWQALPQGVPGLPGKPSPRGQAARLLLDDLKARLDVGDLDIAEARRLAPDLLADAVPDPAERARAAQDVAATINQSRAAAQSVARDPAPPSDGTMTP